MQALVITPVLCQPLDKALYCNLLDSMTLHQQDLNAPVKVCTTSKDLLQLKPTASTLCPLLERQAPASNASLVITPVFCQPLDKAVYCNLQVSMTLDEGLT